MIALSIVGLVLHVDWLKSSILIALAAAYVQGFVFRRVEARQLENLRRWLPEESD